eukprot:PhF_6_TR3709/c0_g1_i1/m.5295
MSDKAEEKEFEPLPENGEETKEEGAQEGDGGEGEGEEGEGEEGEGEGEEEVETVDRSLQTVWDDIDTRTANYLTDVLQWKGDLALSKIENSIAPINPLIPQELSNFWVPTVMYARVVRELDGSGVESDIVIVITPEYFIICDINGNVQRISFIHHIVGLFVQSIEIKVPRRSRSLLALIRFGMHVPEGDVLCRMVNDPRNGTVHDEEGNLLRTLCSLLPEVPLRTIPGTEDIKMFWDFVPRVMTDEMWESMINKIAETRAAQVVNNYPTEIEDVSRGLVIPQIKKSTIVFTAPRKASIANGTTQPPQTSTTSLLNLQTSKLLAKMTPVSTRRDAVGYTDTASTADSNSNKKFCDTAVGVGVVIDNDLPPSQPEARVPIALTKPPNEAPALYPIRPSRAVPPPQSPIESKVKISLKEKCRALFNRLYSVQGKEKLCDVERMLKHFEGQEEVLHAMLQEEVIALEMSNAVALSRRNKVNQPFVL